MIRAGRASLLTLLVIAAVVIGGVVILLLAVPDSPESAATAFMSALAKGDVKKLTALSDVGDETPAQCEKQWNFAVNVAGKYYRFVYHIIGSKQSDPTDAAVRMRLFRNPEKPGAYEDTFEIPLVKRDGKWKVDVRSMNRDIYPALPQ